VTTVTFAFAACRTYQRGLSHLHSANPSGVLYTGVTNQLEGRVAQHKQKLIPGFAKKYDVVRLVYFEPFSDVHSAISRKKQIKR
jgi:putative endonuclease